MQHALSATHQHDTDAESHARNLAEENVSRPLRNSDLRVGAVLLDESESLSLLSDEALQTRIETCGIQLQAAHKLGMKGEARRWLSEQERTLRERHRRPHIVRAMEEALRLDSQTFSGQWAVDLAKGRKCGV